MKDAGISYGHLVYFTAFWYILGLFGIFYTCLVVYFSPFWFAWYILWLFRYIFILVWWYYIFPVLVCCTKKNLATLPSIKVRRACLHKLRSNLKMDLRPKNRVTSAKQSLQH
jgi:hypothetical protein